MSRLSALMSFFLAWSVLFWTGALGAAENPGTDNHLIESTSHYLQRHSTNPVNWYPWGDEALQKAREEDRMIFLSIGYTACHWCQVMESESFNDPEIAAYLNEHFINIIVDREQRPDLDHHFMEILEELTGLRGWPLNLFLTPDLKPVYGGVYFPPKSHHGQSSFQQILELLVSEWNNNRSRVLAVVEKRVGRLSSQKDIKRNLTRLVSQPRIVTDARVQVANYWTSRYDSDYSGFDLAPKFPRPGVLSFLLRHSHQTENPKLSQQVFKTLDRMASSGIRDQLGGAFHRYAVDLKWRVPHFEVMLAENALLARTYMEAFQMSGNPVYRKISKGILAALNRDMRVEGGCYAVSQDATSEGEEGGYYTWPEEMVKALVGNDKEGQAFRDAYLDPFEGIVNDRFVLSISDEFTLEEALDRFKKQRAILVDARKDRIKPHLNDQLLTSWNALAVSAMVRAGVIFQKSDFLESGQECLRDLLTNSFNKGRLAHSRRQGKAGQAVFLEDYTHLVLALLDAYGADFDTFWLSRAEDLAQEMLNRFQPGSGKALLRTPVSEPTVIPAKADVEDGALPSGNTAALVGLSRLSLLTGNPRLEREARLLRERLAPLFLRVPETSPFLTEAWDYKPDNVREVVIVGPRNHMSTKKMLKLVQTRFLPGTVYAWSDPDQRPGVDFPSWLPFLNRKMINARPTAYICSHRVCFTPTNSVSEMGLLLYNSKKVKSPGLETVKDLKR
ncbi:MAG: thioredoxin domain-containing protein [Magnetococcales bacterium]|nr:thioredoxin domain-containing protein [Magnetococcales bacterium]